MADILAVCNEYRTENWSALIQEYNANGLSNREFCRQHGISEKSFYYIVQNNRRVHRNLGILTPFDKNRLYFAA